MSNEIAVVNEQRALTAGEIRSHVNRVQEVMKAVMLRGTHYGIIPGSKKPSLYKPGAEVLCVTFRVAPSYKIEELSTDDCVRYRITCVGTHQATGVVLGEGVGECSSNEEKYKWRRAICQEEYNNTPADRKRIKYGKLDGEVERTQQLRTEPADIANTVLKMAVKRAQVAMTLNVTAASDCFTQDIEDLPPELLEIERNREQASKPPEENPPYPAADFEKNIEVWRKAINEGRASAEQIIARSSTKYMLSDEQKSAIRAPIEEAPEAAPIDGEWVAEYAGAEK
jgi:hypothetical protein